jgi:predicted ATPase
MAEDDPGAPSVTYGHLISFKLEGLFGDRQVEFSPATGGPTLLTGANGTGKSTVLRAINAVGSGQWLDLLAVPFARLTLEFERGDSIHVGRFGDENELLSIAQGANLWALDPDELVFSDRDELANTQEVRRLPDGRWEFEGHVFLYNALRQVLAIRELADDDDAGWINDIPRRFPVLYVPDQRLGARVSQLGRPGFSRGGPVLNTVDQYARDLRRIITDGLSTYAAKSQTLDRLFPERVVDEMESGAPIDIGEVRSMLEAISDEREALEEAGLLEREEHPAQFNSDRLSDENVAPVIKVYAEQTLEKFAVLDDLKEKLKTFSAFLKTHYRDKFIFVRPGAGFSIASTRHNSGKELEVIAILRPSELSSGEQQMLVLAYEVIFRTAPNTLILIDEPELSLHVLWQSTLVDDLAAMGSFGDLNFILATHSPTLIADREELRVSLDRDDPRSAVTTGE